MTGPSLAMTTGSMPRVLSRFGLVGGKDVGGWHSAFEDKWRWAIRNASLSVRLPLTLPALDYT